MIGGLLARATPYKLYFLAGAGVAVGVVAFGAGWVINGWRMETALSKLKTAQAVERANQANSALTTLQADAAAIHQAATEYAGVQNTLAPKIAALTKELRNAKPLPVDCRPDSVRVRNLDAAIDAANSAIPR
jgi:Tfp pilus assembly protein PilN